MEDEDDVPHITDNYSSNGNITKSSGAIETIDVTNYHVSNKKSRHSTVYDKNLCKDNKPLTDFINNCLLLDSTSGMEKVINKVLLPAYVRADKDYKQTQRFKKVITKAFDRLKNDPDRKYTHISDVVETLKIHVSSSPEPAVRKRVNFTTKVSAKTNENCRKRLNSNNSSSSSKVSSKKPKLQVIALDCDDDDVIPIDDEANENPINQAGEINIKNSAAENHLVNDGTIEIQDSQEVKIIDDAQTDEGNESSTNDRTAIEHDKPNNNVHILNEHEKEILGTNENLSDENKLLVPHKERFVKPKKKEPTAEPPVKKRVNLITLSTKVSAKTNEHCRKRLNSNNSSSSSDVSSKKPKLQVIALDCDEDDVIPIDDKANGTTINQAREINTKNGVAKDHLVNDDTNDKTAIEQNKPHNNEHFLNEHEKEILGSNENLSDENILLVPHKERFVRLEKPKKKKEKAKMPKDMTDIEKANRIKIIEAQIESCNKAIAKLDLEEVTDDSANSPYFKCDRLRATIVKLYKELCTLVGEEPPERRKIRLQIREGVPQGPIKRLEKYLNKQADDEGETPFPDFSDVVRCVEKANVKDGLGWSKAKIMSEAQAIFTYCGRALQKRRQQREWKHLRGMARPGEFEADPAERDHELQARLEANRRLAKQREAEVFSKFTHMENVPEPIASASFQIEEPSIHEDSSSDEETELTQNPTESIQNYTKSIQNPTESIQSPTKSMQSPTESTVKKENKNNDSINNENNLDTDVEVKQEPEELPIKIQYRGDISLVIDISDSESDDEYGGLMF